MQKKNCKKSNILPSSSFGETSSVFGVKSSVSFGFMLLWLKSESDSDFSLEKKNKKNLEISLRGERRACSNERFSFTPTHFGRDHVTTVCVERGAKGVWLFFSFLVILSIWCEILNENII